MKSVTIKNLKALDAFAKKMASSLKGGEVIGLVGDLGAGKTAFTQRLAAALGVKKEVKSPTFILMQCFETGAASRKKGIVQLCHVDAYRFDHERELAVIGFGDYAGRQDTVTVVEWSDRAPSLHKREDFKEITFGFGKGEERILTLE
jgi:tRNA threonylcarbamoyladenosine biosynthesis protein TsaE